MRRFYFILFTACIFLCLVKTTVLSQDLREPSSQQNSRSEEISEQVPDKIDIQSVAEDQEIADRLLKIMKATGWFQDVTVQVDEGVVFINGMTDQERHKEWITQLAANTQDVVAVVNSVTIREKSMLDFSDSAKEVESLLTSFLRNLPLILLSVILLILTFLISRWSSVVSGSLLQNRIKSQILRGVVIKGISTLIFVLGIYFMLKISGLTKLAVTLLSGTGIIGLIIGFAFRDIAENFLASILISIQSPFAMGDVIEVDGKTGIVQSVNTRSTLMMTFDGNHVQIPNAMIYKGVIINYTANPNARFDFSVGIGYDDVITQAQEVAMKVLKEHNAVLNDPEPMVLVTELGSSTVNLRIYFWTNIAKHNGLKVKSSVIRLVKVALIEAGISMPDEAREVVFPNGVPIRTIEQINQAAPPKKELTQQTTQKEKAEATPSEGNLDNDDHEIQKQADKARCPEGGENLLEGGG